MTTKLSSFLLAALFSLFIFSSCDSEKKLEDVKIDPAFSQYISAFTSGKISKEGTIRVRLSEAQTGEINYDTPIEQELFDFSPSVEGEAYWADNQTIEFVPAEPLPSGEVYDVEFDLEELVPNVPSNLEAFNFRFKTLDQSFEVFVDGMKPYENKVLDWLLVKGTVNTADVIEDEAVESIIQASQNNSNLKVQWTHSADRKKPLFHY